MACKLVKNVIYPYVNEHAREASWLTNGRPPDIAIIVPLAAGLNEKGILQNG